MTFTTTLRMLTNAILDAQAHRRSVTAAQVTSALGLIRNDLTDGEWALKADGFRIDDLIEALVDNFGIDNCFAMKVLKARNVLIETGDRIKYATITGNMDKPLNLHAVCVALAAE